MFSYNGTELMPMGDAWQMDKDPDLQGFRAQSGTNAIGKLLFDLPTAQHELEAELTVVAQGNGPYAPVAHYALAALKETEGLDAGTAPHEQEASPKS